MLELFCTEGADVRHPTVVASALELGIRTNVVSEHVAATLSETRAPQGVIAVCAMPDVSLSTVLATSPRLVAVLVDVSDPGNAGTVIRAADAAGADAVVFAGTTVDPYNGKCVRASTGSIFHLPVVTDVAVTTAVDAMRDAGLSVVAADGSAPIDVEQADAQGLLADRTAWFFGHEVRGLASDAPLAADHVVRIPIHGRAESLNLATAAAVCLYASARAQRRTTNSG